MPVMFDRDALLRVVVALEGKADGDAIAARDETAQATRAPGVELRRNEVEDLRARRATDAAGEGQIESPRIDEHRERGLLVPERPRHLAIGAGDAPGLGDQLDDPTDPDLALVDHDLDPRRPHLLAAHADEARLRKACAQGAHEGRGVGLARDVTRGEEDRRQDPLLLRSR
jgi:hypothetical protein